MSWPGMQAQAFIRRRRLLQGTAAWVTLGAAAAPAAALQGAALVPSPLVTLDAPAVADNGAFVPVTVASALPGTREIMLLVGGNPQPVAASFMIPAGTEAFVATRIRMAASGIVHAVVRTDEGLFVAMREVQVMVSGCA
jgi:sulfur-oxidizing protein SoxY